VKFGDLANGLYVDALTNNMRPGNVRDLANLIERAVIVTPGENFRCRALN
jgi:DNA-binding NtrC family response regulator